MAAMIQDRFRAWCRSNDPRDALRPSRATRLPEDRFALSVPIDAVEHETMMTWRGLGLDAALLPIAAMLAFSAAFTAIAIWRFEWEE